MGLESLFRNVGIFGLAVLSSCVSGPDPKEDYELSFFIPLDGAEVVPTDVIGSISLDSTEPFYGSKGRSLYLTIDGVSLGEVSFLPFDLRESGIDLTRLLTNVQVPRSEGEHVIVAERGIGGKFYSDRSVYGVVLPEDTGER